jgi:phosphohistidine phosphatase
MNLHIVRHADAGNRDEWTGDDADRPLTPLGHNQARALGEALRDRGVILDVIVSSPLVRARQTAEGLLGARSNGSGPELCDLLATDSLRRRKLTRYLAGLGVENLAIIGHDPELPAYLAWLIGACADNIHLQKAGAALVRFEGEPRKGEGQLAWVVNPDWFMAPQSEPVAV